jgi:L-asparagine oxygenase
MSDVPRLSLSPPDCRTLLDASRELSHYSVSSDADGFVLEAQVQSGRLSSDLRRALLEFRRFGDASGGLLIQGVPIGELPATPDRPDRLVGAQSSCGACLSTLVACLGDQYGFRPELGGSMVQDIVPVPGFEYDQISVGSATDLCAHTETAFSPHRPDYVALLCLRPDHEECAGTTLSSIDEMLPLLDAQTIATLREPRFRTKVDPSFLLGDNLTEEICIDPIWVLGRSEQRPHLRVDFAGSLGTEGNDPPAQRALEALCNAARDVRTTVRLKAGDLLIIDNNRAVHGRTLFVPRYDGRDRWLLRSFVARDLGRSADVRPGDERVVVPDYAAEGISA